MEHLIDARSGQHPSLVWLFCPAKPLQVALYMSFLIKSAKTSAPIEEAVNSL